MPLYQVTCRELVYIDRTYEIEAESATAARAAIEKSMGAAGTFVDEHVQDTYSFENVLKVFDDTSNESEE